MSINVDLKFNEAADLYLAKFGYYPFGEEFSDITESDMRNAVLNNLEIAPPPLLDNIKY